MEGFIDLFECEDKSGKRPHFKGYIKINGEKLEFAVWPGKSGKPGVYSGKVQPQREKAAPAEPISDDSPPF